MGIQKLSHWLETHWVTPAYGGLVLGGIALCFFGAATNTMAGWLYVISGAILALLVIGAILPPKAIQSLQIRRLPLPPISQGDRFSMTIEIVNPTAQAKTLIQIRDRSPLRLTSPQQTVIEAIPPHTTHRWTYTAIAQHRGIYHWHNLALRSASPLGLFWCERASQATAKVVVYPQVLPLTRSPLLDTLGRDDSWQTDRDRRYQDANEGMTRTLRPYRIGDPTRLIHWRSSARFGEFQVRELETFISGQAVIIGLDTAATWSDALFEQAAIAAASLYFYAHRCQLSVQLWTASTGLIRGHRVVLEALAAALPQEAYNQPPPFSNLPWVWLTPQAGGFATLPPGSRGVWFVDAENPRLPKTPGQCPILAVNQQEDLKLQLGQSL
ncbi:MAG: DUF58 domain-containing protein [Jaaginema sp. PMC 1079.18]|nr:DUF58 domain-containing protein [Jaaginema sp. PMC 1080.18]MEC4852647.1 DUF58 domain-containing protein [Jaaginema sp. PMC 1079.18]MEC4864616.1 DUF58 domain-containing protein [Jaaginema sp. PMC 1078.18]